MRPILLFVLVLGCSEAALTAEEPVWGKQQCAHCAMLVSEKAPAAQAVTLEGKRRFFDDLGCMVAWESREAPKVRARWVRGPGGTGWVEPGSTRFASGRPTPMDFGFVADTQGTATFEDVRSAVLSKIERGSR